MARAIARGLTAGCTYPVLELWVLGAGLPVDVYALEFAIFDATGAQTFPVSGFEPVAVTVTCPTAGAGRIQVGRYVATWPVPSNEPLGAHTIVWNLRRTITSAVETYRETFDVLAQGLRLKQPAYVLLSELREEGFSSTALSDARALKLITTASLMVERFTRRFFDVRYLRQTLSGSGGGSLQLDVPVIALDGLSVDGGLIDPAIYSVFNRHLSERMLQPDDREAGMIAFTIETHGLGSVRVYDSGPRVYRRGFWGGTRNVSLSGLFGYTDYDEDQMVGVTPEAIKRATMMLIARELVGIGNVEARFEQQSVSRIRDLRTRDQSVSYGTASSSGGSGSGGGVGLTFTGDPAIDTILELYSAPPFIGSA